jgi:hypothetical protein
MSTTLALVGCGAKKTTGPRPARELYTSPLFRMSLAYAERLTPNVWIVSALHGLLPLDQVIEPYNLKLSDLNGQTQREAWGWSVVDALAARAPRGSHAVLLCGKEYADVLWGPLKSHGISIEEPLAGKQIGERLSWLKAQLEAPPSPAPAGPLGEDDVRKALGFATEAQAQASRVRPDIIAHALEVLTRASEKNVTGGRRDRCVRALATLRQDLAGEAS